MWMVIWLVNIKVSGILVACTCISVYIYIYLNVCPWYCQISCLHGKRNVRFIITQSNFF